MSAEGGRWVVRSSADAMSSRLDTSTSISGAASGTSSVPRVGDGGRGWSGDVCVWVGGGRGWGEGGN